MALSFGELHGRLGLTAIGHEDRHAGELYETAATAISATSDALRGGGAEGSSE